MNEFFLFASGFACGGVMMYLPGRAAYHMALNRLRDASDCMSRAMERSKEAQIAIDNYERQMPRMIEEMVQHTLDQMDLPEEVKVKVRYRNKEEMI